VQNPKKDVDSKEKHNVSSAKDNVEIKEDSKSEAKKEELKKSTKTDKFRMEQIEDELPSKSDLTSENEESIKPIKSKPVESPKPNEESKEVESEEVKTKKVPSKVSTPSKLKDRKETAIKEKKPVEKEVVALKDKVEVTTEQVVVKVEKEEVISKKKPEKIESFGLKDVDQIPNITKQDLMHENKDKEEEIQQNVV